MSTERSEDSDPKGNALDWVKWAEANPLMVTVIEAQDNYVIRKPEVLDLSRARNVAGDVEFVQATREELVKALGATYEYRAQHPEYTEGLKDWAYWTRSLELAQETAATWGPESWIERRIVGPIERVPEPDQGPAANCAYCVGAGGYEDHDGTWVECSCQRFRISDPDHVRREERMREKMAEVYAHRAQTGDWPGSPTEPPREVPE